MCHGPICRQEIGALLPPWLIKAELGPSGAGAKERGNPKKREKSRWESSRRSLKATQKDVEGAMSFLLKPRPRMWDLALDYHTAKQFEVDVTLDPATAGPEVILSEDLKEASWGRPGLPWPDAPGRFDTDPCLLGKEGFTSGRHYWELEATGRFWAVGVALESVQRKGRVLFKPSAHIWGLQRYDELCVALTAPSNTSVPLGNGGIGVYLDYEVGEVSFYAVGSRQRIFTFPVGSFSGERVFPYFCVLLSTIRLSAKGSIAAGAGS
ncbi:E3 ubiquitin-protein ligase TRIM7-like isoform X1 [Pezoporus occidentalis]|uniref:E3 ubiquitin-protein ligase TRIM7-like isoform X1 n=2 Tax=Pezoporus occidentalis TaxID=407982 RepID=UPI002F90F2BB